MNFAKLISVKLKQDCEKLALFQFPLPVEQPFEIGQASFVHFLALLYISCDNAAYLLLSSD